MYSKNRIPMYEGDGFIHSSPIQEGDRDFCVLVAPGSQAESRRALSGAARELRHKFAVWFRSNLRHPQGKAP